MPILFNDIYGGGQQEVDLGRSRISPRETFSTSADGMRSNYADSMRNVDSLVSALSGLSRAAGIYEANKQAQTDDTLDRTKDLLTGVKTDDAVGAFSSAASGVISSGASPRMQNRLQQHYGNEAARSYLATNEELQKILADDNLKSQPQEFEKRIEGFVSSSIEELRKRNPNMIFAGGAATFIRNFANNAKSNSFEYANQQAKETMRRAGILADRDSIPQSATFSRVEPVIQGLNGDVTEARQVLSIENPQMNTRAISPERSSNAASGLFQIKPNTFAEVAQYPEARQYNLTNPLDERQNAIAYQLYWNRMKEQAKQILGREPKTAETYMLYNLGPGAGGNALKAYAAGNDAPLSQFASEAAIKGNGKLYGPSSTVSGALERIDGLMKGGSDFHAPVTPLASRQRVELTQDNFNSRNYSWSDFKNNGVYGGRGQVDSRIVNILDDVTEQFGRKFKILSAHRDSGYDKSVGGGGNHPHGDAIDIDLSGLSADEKKKAVALFVANGVRGVGTYASGNSIHIDLGVGREKSGRQGEGVQTWNSAGHSWFSEGVASGKEIAGSGYVRRPGFQGVPFNSTEARVRNLTEKYGYSPNDARKAIILETQNFALNQAHAGMGAEGTLTAEALRSNLKLTPTEELSLNQTLSSVDAIQRQLYAAKSAKAKMEADEYEATGIREALKAEKEGRTYRPDPDKMPTTAEGRVAYQRLSSLGLAPIPVAADVSATNLASLSSRVDDPEFYKELGFEDGKRPRNVTEALAAIQRNKRLDLTPDARIKLAEEIEKRRVGGPVAERYAEASTKENSAKIADSFTINTAALQKLNMNPDDPRQLQAELTPYLKRMSDFYQNNYAVLYMSAMRESPNGAQLSAEERDGIAKRALENTQAYGRYLSSIVANTGPRNREEAMTNQVLITNPDAVVKNLITTKGGRIDGEIAGIPRGSTIVFDTATGKPLQTPDGSYAVRLPSGETIYYNTLAEAGRGSSDIRAGVDAADNAGMASARVQGNPNAPQAAPAPTTPVVSSSDTPEGQRSLEQEATRRNAIVSGARSVFSNAMSTIEPIITSAGVDVAVQMLSEAINSNPEQAEEIRKLVRNSVNNLDPVLRELRTQRSQLERPEMTSLRPNAPKRGMTTEERAEIAEVDKAIAKREKILTEAFKTILNK